MKYILKVKAYYYFAHSQPEWTRIRFFHRHNEERYPMCAYDKDENRAFKFDTLREIRKAANLLLTREKKSFVRVIKQVEIEQYPYD